MYSKFIHNNGDGSMKEVILGVSRTCFLDKITSVFNALTNHVSNLVFNGDYNNMIKIAIEAFLNFAEFSSAHNWIQ